MSVVELEKQWLWAQGVRCKEVHSHKLVCVFVHRPSRELEENKTNLGKRMSWTALINNRISAKSLLGCISGYWILSNCLRGCSNWFSTRSPITFININRTSLTKLKSLKCNGTYRIKHLTNYSQAFVFITLQSYSRGCFQTVCFFKSLLD